MAQARSNPSDIARETVRLLAQRRIAPTPENYQRIYHEVAGTAAGEPFPARALKGIAASLPRDTAEATRSARRLEQIAARGSWDELGQLLREACIPPKEDPPPWGGTIRELVSEFERHHLGLTMARKREALQHVLSSASDPSTLHQRVAGLVKGWRHHQSQEAPEAADDDAAGAPQAEAAAAPVAAAPAPALPAAPPIAAGGQSPSPPAGAHALAPVIAHLLEGGLSPLIVDGAELVAELRSLADELRSGPEHLLDRAYQHRLDGLVQRLEWVAEEQLAVRSGLIGLLRLILQNISQLVVDDRWLHGQMTLLTETFSRPLDVRVLDEVERRLRDVIDKQGHLKRELNDAQQRLKTMLSGFIDRLAEFSATTGDYHDRLGSCAQRISDAEDIGQLTDVVEELLRETRVAQDSARRSHDELHGLKQEVELANVEIVRLQQELDQASELVRHDPLTGTLNRKGMDDALEREISRARRKDSPLCVGLLDVDNFKQLNDTYGHRAGDDALRHLAEVIRDNVRPQDSVARYGGEEFLIVLPDTDTEDGAATITRLQRALTKRYFLADNKKLLITFSAGVTRIGAEETPQQAIERADRAMYLAKRAGKNRVMTA